MSFDTKILLKQIKDDEDLEARILAIKRLGMIYDNETIIDPLLKLLLDSNSKIRELAILSLSVQNTSPKIINPIINALNDEEKNVQLAAIKALSEFRSIIATKKLIKILTDPDDEVRSAAVLALGLIQDKNSLFPLIDCLEDNDPQVIINALVSLSQLGDPRAIDPIIDLIQGDVDISVKHMAILSLGPLAQNDKRIIKPLIKLLSSPDPKTRQYSILSLGKTKSSEIINPLIEVINDEDAFVRRACASALSEIKDPKTIEHYIGRLNDPNKEIRETAARALGKLGNSSSVPELIKKINDREPEVREEVAEALGELQNDKASKPLIKSLKKEENTVVRIAIIKAIGKIEGNLRTTPSLFLTNSAIRPLTKLLTDDEISVRATAAESLAKIYLNEDKYLKSQEYYLRASVESLAWEFTKSFYLASSIGCGILDKISKKNYKINQEEFKKVYDNLQNSAKMMGNQTFISVNYWKMLEIYNKIFNSSNKGQFIQRFRDLGLKLLLLTKKLPEEKASLLNKPQDRLNEKFQMIDKRGLSLDESIEEMENLKPDIFEIGNKILQIEPLELRMDEDQEKTVNIIEDLVVTPTNVGFNGEFDIIREEEEIIQRHVSKKKDRKFIIEQVNLIGDQNLWAGETVKIALIQYLKGATKKSFIEKDRDLWERSINRYYDLSVYKNNRILQFTKESIQMRAKPKIIGYLDDAIYEKCKMVIFPECSIPESYVSKLQEFSNRFNIFIIAGSEIVVSKGKNFNRAYVISPLADKIEFQQKNTPTIIPKSEHLEAFKENIESTNPPVLKLFNSPFGKFTILIGQDIKELSQYLPFIVRERYLDFVVFLNNGIENDISLKNYQELATEIKIPVVYVNSGAFGGTKVFNPNESENIDFMGKYSEGIIKWSIKIPESDLPEI